MKESTETGGGKHSAKHGRTPLEVDADRVTIQFGPEVRRELTRLQEAVRGKEGFDSDAFALLERLNKGQPIEIGNAITNLAMVIHESTEYEARSGDVEVGRALTDVIGHLMGQSPQAKPIAVFVEPKLRSR